jgi:hypothetical protein
MHGELDVGHADRFTAMSEDGQAGWRKHAGGIDDMEEKRLPKSG